MFFAFTLKPLSARYVSVLVVDNIYPLPVVLTPLDNRTLPGGILNEQLAILYAKRFIQRRDVKAVQFREVNGQPGGYVPDSRLKHLGTHGPTGFLMDHLHAHLEGRATYGHYLLDQQDQARMFCLDIDLEETGFYVPLPSWSEEISEEDWVKHTAPVECNPRELWTSRTNPDARQWFKYQMGMLARKFTRVIIEELNLPTAAAYSGHKGIHVYGFTGPMPAAQVREAALFVLDILEDWNLYRGQHTYKHAIWEPALGYQNFTLEVYPKQDSLDDKDLGNLLRLPLGRNLKSQDPTFFLDLTTAPGQMKPHENPVALLESGNPYA